MLHLLLIPLDYCLSAGVWPVKVAEHPYQGMTLTGHTLADLYRISGIRINVSQAGDAFPIV